MRTTILNLKMASRSVFANKVRAFLTLLGILIGVASVISIMSIGAGAQSLITGSIKELGTNLVAVLPGAANDNGPPASALGIVTKTLVNKDVEDIRKLPHVTAVNGYANGSGDLVHANRTMSGTFTGVHVDYQVVEDHQIQDGRFFTEQEERTAARLAVLGMDIKDELYPLSNPVGSNIKINNVSFKVIGLLERKGSGFVRNPDNGVYIPLSTAQKVLLGQNHLGLVRLRVDKEENTDKVKDAIRKTLRFNHGIQVPANDDFSVRSLDQALGIFESVTDALRYFLASVAAISLIVGGIGITNIMLMTVKERTREIGLRKALGATPEQIKNQFLLEATILTISGGILGIILGTVISFLIGFGVQQLDYEWEFSIPPESIVISIVVSGLIGLTFGTSPAKKAAKLNPIESLRYE